MSNFDYVAYTKNKYNKKKSKEDENKTTQKSNGFDYVKYSKQKSAQKSLGLDTLESDLKSMGETVIDIGENWQTQETMNNTRASVESMYNRLLSYQEYQKEYGGGADVSNLVSAYKTALDNWDKRTTLYGGFKNAEAYDKEYKNLELSNKFRVKTGTNKETGEDEYRGLTYDEVQAELKNYAPDSDEYKFLSNYTGYTDLADFDKAIKNTKPLEYPEWYANVKENYDNWNIPRAGEFNEEKTKETRVISYYTISDQRAAEEAREKYFKEFSGGKTLAEFETEFEAKKKNSYLEKLKTQRNVWALDNTFDLYDHYLDAEDFSDKSQYWDGHAYATKSIEDAISAYDAISAVSEDTHMVVYNENTETYYVYSDPLYEYVNNKNDARKTITSRAVKGGVATGAGYPVGGMYENKGYDELYPEEIGVFNFLDATEGRESAKAYLEKMSPMLTKRKYDKQTQEWETAADSGVWADIGLSVLTVPANIVGGMGNAFATIEENIKGEEYNPYHSYRTMGNFASDTRGYISENIEETTEGFELFGQNIPSFLYNTGMSIADTYVGGKVFGKGYSLVAGSNAFQQKAKELKEAGEDESTIYQSAFASGTAEVLFEYISLDKLFKIKSVDSGVKVFKTAAAQGGIELSEEFFTEAANIFSDTAIRGESSELYQFCQDLKDRGYTESEIKTELAKKVGGQLGWAAAGGFLSGGGMGTVASYNSYSGLRSIGKGIRSNERTSDMLDIAALNPQESAAYEAYNEYVGKGVTADNITNAQLGNLYALTNEGAQNTLSSKKSTLEQKRAATETLKKLSVVDEQNTVSKDTINQIDQNISTREAYMESADELIATGLESGKDTKSYKLATEYKQKLDNGQKLTEEEVASLVKANSEAIQSESIENFTKTMSEEDATLFTSQYDGKTDIDAFGESFNLVKTLTENNYSPDYILEHKGVLTEKQVAEIYKSKVLNSDKSLENAITSLKEKHANTPFIEGTFDDSVINYDNTNVEGKVNWNSLNSNQKKAIAVLGQVGKRAGMDVELISDGLERGINGAFEISGNKMLIDIYAGMDKVDGSKLQDTIIPTTSHEMTHWMKSKSPTLYRKYDNYVFGTLTMSGKSESDILSARRKKMEAAHPGEKFTDAEVRDEVIARASEDMFAKSEEIKKFLNTLTDSEKKSFVEKVKEILQNVKEWLNDFLSKQKSTSDEAKIIRQYADRIDEQIKLWDKMLISSISANQALKKEGITGEELANKTSNNVQEMAREHYWYPNMSKSEIAYVRRIAKQELSTTDNYLDEQNKWLYNVKNGNTYFALYSTADVNEPTILYACKNTRAEKEYTWFMRFIEELRSVDNGNYEQSTSVLNQMLEAFWDDYGSNNRHIGNGLGRRSNGRDVRATNQRTDFRPSEALFNCLRNIAKTQKQNERNRLEQYSDRDTLGNTLTEAQQSYFAESKVRDENGNLKVMYHGSPNADFTIFKSGTYFTEHKWYADVYQNQGASSLSYKKTANKPDTYAVYLDIKKPFDTRNKTERDIFYNEYYQQWGTGTDLMESGLPDWLDGQDLQEFLEEKGYDYDGLILDEGATGGYGDEVISRGISYVVFSPEQVKSVDNKTPTDNPDYRFSMRENVEETKELIAVHNMRVSELEKSLQLGGLPMPSIAIIKAQSGHSEYGDVSLVFNKDTIDPKLSKDNKVYGGDAWTPTYPTIEYKANEKVAEKVRKLYYDFAKEYGYDEARPLYNVAQDLEDELNRHKGEAGLIDYYKDDTRLMNFYLLHSGKGKIEPVMKETRTEMSEVEIEQSKYLINALGEDIINEIKVDNGGSPMSRRKAYFEKNGSKIETAYKQMFSEMYDFSEEQIQNVISQTKQFDYVRMINSAYKYLHNDTVTVKVEEDSSATKEAIRNAASDGYSQWLDNLFKGAEEKSGIRNNVDYFTPMGNRRSFEALHWENNLENVVRVMRSQEETGGGALISGFGIFGVSAKNYKSIAEIKADSERLTHIPEEEYKEIRKGFSARLNEICESIMDKSADNPFIALDNACECVVDAIRISKTKSGILKNLKQYPQLSVTETTVDDIVALVTDIANMPTEYFEAKPRRAVGFDEVATAIIPDSANAELKTKLTDYGIKFVEYEAENEESRLKALNSLEDVKFSDRDSEGNELSKEQQDFFANSKVRDTEGNLLVCYHGTDAEFTTFDADFISQDNKLGFGFYFMAGKKLQYSYKYPLKTYLNITNPITDTRKKFSKEALSEFCDNLGIKFDYDSADYDLDVYERLSYSYTGKTENFLKAVIDILGVDGIISENRSVAVAFSPEQIKLTSNTNPTSNPDIRYSDRDNVSVYDTMGETDRLIKENTQLKEDVERLKERLKLERQITNGNHFNENQLDAVAAHIRNIAKSNYSKPDLVNLLKGVYSYIATSKELNWDDLFSQAYDVARMVLDEARPITETNDYYKMILNDIRGTKISVNEQQIQNARYKLGNRWRNVFFNKVKITDNAISLDRQWQSWANDYPDLFDAEISDADQLVELYDIYDSVKEGSEVVVEYDIEEQTRWLAREIYNQYWNVSPIRTTADKYDKQIKRLNFEHRQAMKEFRDSYEEKLKNQHKVDKEKAQELIKKIRERKDKEIAEVKKRSKERMDAYKENAERKTKIQSITSNALTLNKWLTKNSKEYHIHEAMKGPVLKLLQAIDFSSKRMLEKNIPTQKDITFAKAFASINEMLIKATAGEEGLVEFYGHDLADDIKALVDAADNLVGDNIYVINQMSLEELQHLDRLVKYIKKVVTDLNKFHEVNHAKGISDLAEENIEILDKLGEQEEHSGLRGKLDAMFKWDNANPYFAFKRLGAPAMKVFEALQNGWDKLALHLKQITDFTNELYSDKEVKEWGEKTETFTIAQPNGKNRTFKMTIAQIMALHCVAKQDDAIRHLMSGGMTLAEFEENGKVKKEKKNILLTENDLKTITKTLDKIPRAKEVADKLQDFMNTVCSDWGNEVSMARFFVKMFTNPNYFPIKVSPATISKEEPDGVTDISLFRLLNMSFTKSRNEYANQSIEIGNIFDIFSQHTSDMAKYNALALPILDAYKWYSYKRTDTMGTEYSLYSSLETALGGDSVRYVNRFLKDLNGSNNVARDNFGSDFFRNAKIAAVAFNLRTILLQPISFLRAKAVMKNKYLVKAFLHTPKIAKSKEHCGMALWKSLGYYDVNVSRGLTEKIKHADGWKDKVIDFSMKGMEKADELTMGYLWNACELEIRETRKDLKVGSKEFYETIGKRLREIIYTTQVVDSTMTRSQMMRSPDGKDKMLTAFMSEATLSYNLLQDGFYTASLEKRANGKVSKETKKQIFHTVSAYIVTNAVAAIIESGFDAFRDDDEEMDVETFMRLYLTNFAEDLSIIGKIPYLKEILSAIDGYNPSRSDTQWMYSGVKAANNWIKAFSGDEGQGAKALKNTLRTFSDFTGLGVYNAYRDFMATLNKLDILTAEELEEMLDELFS